MVRHKNKKVDFYEVSIYAIDKIIWYSLIVAATLSTAFFIKYFLFLMTSTEFTGKDVALMFGFFIFLTGILKHLNEYESLFGIVGLNFKGNNYIDIPMFTFFLVHYTVMIIFLVIPILKIISQT